MSKINIWLGLPIKNLSKLFIASHWPSHIKDCRQCSYWMLILIFIKLNDYTHTIVHLFKKQKQMEMKASEAPQSLVRKTRPLQRFSLKRRRRSLKTVMRSCRRLPLQLLIACCLKTKKIPRYELKPGLTDTNIFSVEHELLPGAFCSQWCYSKKHSSVFYLLYNSGV